MRLLWVLIGSFWYFPLFWLAVVITLVLVLRNSVEKRSIVCNFLHFFVLGRSERPEGICGSFSVLVFSGFTWRRWETALWRCCFQPQSQWCSSICSSVNIKRRFHNKFKSLTKADLYLFLMLTALNKKLNIATYMRCFFNIYIYFMSPFFDIHIYF